MGRIGTVFSLVVLTTLPVYGQAAAPASFSDAQDPSVIHVSDMLLRQPEVRQAIASGMLPAPAEKSGEVYAINATRLFRVRDIAAEDTVSPPAFLTLEFTFKATSDRFQIWVESGELANGNVRDEDVEALRVSLAERTPAGSVNSNAGIIVNNESVFGAPPDVDGNGVIFVLLTDVREGRQPGEGFVAGFVDPIDIFSTRGNRSEVLYLDTQPGLVGDTGERRGTGGIENTAAHEYQHLIHLNYDPTEITFTNEGLSEWASVVNGYSARRITYLSNREQYNVPLFRWSSGLTTNVLSDYQRAGLFTAYISERIGVSRTGSITRDSRAAFDGYAAVLAPLGVRDVVQDFHTANLLNDPGLDPRFGYSHPDYTSVRAAVELVGDGTTAGETAKRRISVESGGVRYLTWRNVEDFSLLMDIVVENESDASSLMARRDRIELRAVISRGGSVEIMDFSPDLDPRLFAGTIDRFDLIVANTDPRPEEDVKTGGIHLFLQAGWTANGDVVATQIAYDTGRIATRVNEMGQEQGAFYPVGAAARQATRFVVPQGATLAEIAVAPYYRSQFLDGGLPADTPRDFRLHIWADDGTGLPGAEILSLDVEDQRTNGSLDLHFLPIDLSEHAAQLSGLPASIYVGFSNIGPDENYLILAVSPYEGENVSYLFLPQFGPDNSGGWSPLSEVTSGGEFVFRDRVIPIRATFTASSGAVAIEDEAARPGEPLLAGNYPNPFTGATTIRFSLPEGARTRLTVYDLLGRRIAMLADEYMPAGHHEIRLDASALASGVYVYVLESEEWRDARKMVRR